MAITFDGQNDKITTTSQSLTVPQNVAGTFQAGGLAIGAGATVLVTNSQGKVAIGTATISSSSNSSSLIVNGSIESLRDSAGEGGQVTLRGQAGNIYRWCIDNYYTASTSQFRIFREDDSTSANGITYLTVDQSGNLNLSAAGTKVLNSSGRPILNQTGGILQVVQTLKTDSFTTTSTSFTDVTGLSVSITPSSTSSKILVMANVPFARDGTGSDAWVRLVRDSTVIGNGNSGYFGQAAGQYGLDPVTGSRIYLDSPATTSAVTYKIQTATANNTVYIGTRRLNDFILGCDITVMEISG